MTFTFDDTLSTDLAVVRFEIGDTSDDGHYLEDETINALITSTESVGGAVVACIDYIITQLSQPNFKLDWMSVTNQEARRGFEMLLDRKKIQYGIQYTTKVSSIAAVDLWREDSEQTDGDYTL